MQCHASRKETDNTKQKTVFYTLCVLYVLSVATIAAKIGECLVAFVSNDFFFNVALIGCAHQNDDVTILLQIYIAQSALFGCCDFLAQCILVRTTDNACLFHLFILSSKIHRCWVVWSRNICVVIIPCILAFAYLGRSIYLD